MMVCFLVHCTSVHVALQAFKDVMSHFGSGILKIKRIRDASPFRPTSLLELPILTHNYFKTFKIIIIQVKIYLA